MTLNPEFARKSLPILTLTIYIIIATVGAFTGGLWGGAGIVGAILLFLGARVADGQWPQLPWNLSHLVLMVLTIFAIELPWSSKLGISVHVWIQLATIFVPLLFLTSARVQVLASTPRLLPVAAIALGCGAIALGAELLSGGFIIHAVKRANASLTEYNRGMAHLVILAFPLCAGLWHLKYKKAALALAAALLFPACLTESHTAKLALIVGAVCAMAAKFRPLWVRNGLGAASIALLGWPFYAQYLFSTANDWVEKLHASWLHRMEIWDFLSYRIAERPLMGWGLGTTHTLDFLQPHGDLYHYAVKPAAHAHNYIVELWVETGLPGLALGLVFVCLMLQTAYKRHPALRPFTLGVCAASITICLFGFDFWTDALWAAFALSAFVFGILEQQFDRRQRNRHA